MKVQLKPLICGDWPPGDTRYNLKPGVQYDMHITEPDWDGDKHIAALANPNKNSSEHAYFKLEDLIGPGGLEVSQKNYPELYL